MADVSQPSSLTLEPNPFEQSFASNTQQAPGSSAVADPAGRGQADAPRGIAGGQQKQPFAAGTSDLAPKPPIPGIDKIMTPLPMIPGAPGFAGSAASNLGMFGATSPAGWLPHRFGPGTPGALQIPGGLQALDMFGAQPSAVAALPPGAQTPHLGVGPLAQFSQLIPGIGGAQVPQATPGAVDAFGPAKPGLAGPPLAASASSHQPGPGGPIAANGGGASKPPGENVAANGLYLLSQDPASEKGAPVVRKHSHSSAASADPGDRSPQKGRRSLDAAAAGDHKRLPSTSPAARAAKPPGAHGRKRSVREVEPTLELDGFDDDAKRHASVDPLGDVESEEKRKQFLERNRIAAIKCRARKKQWVDNLQQKAEVLTRINEEVSRKNERLQLELNELRQFVVSYNDPRALPHHIMQIIQGSEPALPVPVSQSYPQLQPQVLPGALPGHAPGLPVMTPGAQGLGPSIASSPQQPQPPQVPPAQPAQQQSQPQAQTQPQAQAHPPRSGAARAPDSRFQPHAHVQIPQPQYAAAPQQ